MTPFLKYPYTAGLALWFAVTGSTMLGQTSPGSKPFVVFDGTGYSHRLDLSVSGILLGTRIGIDTINRELQK